MKRIFYDNTPTVAVVAGSNAFGSVTSVYTTKIPWKGFTLSLNLDAVSYAIWVQFYLNGVAWGPTWVCDPSLSIVYYIPLQIPQGVEIGAAAYYNTSGTPTVNLTLFGKSEGDDILSAMVNLNTPGNNISLSTASTWTQLGPALPSVPIRKVVGAVALSGDDALTTFDIGFGPASTSVTPLATGIQIGSLQIAYVYTHFELDTFFNGSGNYLWGQSPNTNAYVWSLYGY